MARVNIFDEHRQLEGWFDDSKAERFEEATRWDGNNHISIATGSQWDHEQLYRTVGGRWVLHRWSQWQGRPETYRFLTDKEAETWLLANEEDEAVERFFGVIEDERGPGRPEIGPEVYTRLPQEVIEQLDAAAKVADVSRAEIIRRLLERALDGTPEPPRVIDVVIVEAGDVHLHQLEKFTLTVTGGDDDMVKHAADAATEKGYRVMDNADGGCCELVRPGDGEEDYIAITVYPE